MGYGVGDSNPAWDDDLFNFKSRTSTSGDYSSRLSRCSTAKGSGTGFSLLGPANFKACKSFLCTKISIVV